MTHATHETEVSARFNQLHERFKDTLRDDDYRLRGLLNWLGDLEGLRILDVGSGKGRFSRALRKRGASVVGIDISRSMLVQAEGLDRILGSARRLPFASGLFDCVIAIEVFEHLADSAVDTTLRELRRVLRPNGRLAIVDKNAGSLNTPRPWLPNLFVKWIDERRGLWMYPSKGPVREQWFWPNLLRWRMRRIFEDVRVFHLLSPNEARHRIFRIFPRTRHMVLWAAQASGGPRHGS